tara:strand:+ start:169 stop:387 length:219 start_codon:yes stop_codon:yes gene_type:complete
MRVLEDRVGLIVHLAHEETEMADMEDLLQVYYEEAYCRYESMSDGEILDYLEEEGVDVPKQMSLFSVFTEEL